MSMLDLRLAQARILALVWERTAARFGPDAASAILTGALTDDARAAGAAFARQAPHGPSLAHFATVLDRWREGGALDIADIHLTETILSCTVTACAYARSYADMDLPPDLIPLLSCVRDEPFAQGYSPCLSMHRPETIAGGASGCRFVFTWTDCL